jgi:hypothetical protein
MHHSASIRGLNDLCHLPVVYKHMFAVLWMLHLEDSSKDTFQMNILPVEMIFQARPCFYLTPGPHNYCHALSMHKLHQGLLWHTSQASLKKRNYFPCSESRAWFTGLATRPVAAHLQGLTCWTTCAGVASFCPGNMVEVWPPETRLTQGGFLVCRSQCSLGLPQPVSNVPVVV